MEIKDLTAKLKAAAGPDLLVLGGGIVTLAGLLALVFDVKQVGIPVSAYIAAGVFVCLVYVWIIGKRTQRLASALSDVNASVQRLADTSAQTPRVTPKPREPSPRDKALSILMDNLTAASGNTPKPASRGQVKGGQLLRRAGQVWVYSMVLGGTRLG